MNGLSNILGSGGCTPCNQGGSTSGDNDLSTVLAGDPCYRVKQGPPGPKGDKGDQGPPGNDGAPGEPGQDGGGSWNDLTDKPSTFPPSSHTHAQSEVTDLVTDLAARGTLAGTNLWTGSNQFQGTLNLDASTVTIGSGTAGLIRDALELTTLATTTPGTGVATALGNALNASNGLLGGSYLATSVLTSSASIAWDVATVRQPTLALAHNTTITLSNLADGQTVSLGGTMGGSGGYTVGLAHSGLTVREMGGALADIAGLAAGDLFEISCKRVGSDLRVWVSVLEI